MPYTLPLLRNWTSALGQSLLGLPFLTLSGADVDFFGRELRWKIYTTEEALPTTRRIELVSQKEL